MLCLTHAVSQSYASLMCPHSRSYAQGCVPSLMLCLTHAVPHSCCASTNGSGKPRRKHVTCDSKLLNKPMTQDGAAIMKCVWAGQDCNMYAQPYRFSANGKGQVLCEEKQEHRVGQNRTSRCFSEKFWRGKSRNIRSNMV